jgi:hypothetical protein
MNRDCRYKAGTSDNYTAVPVGHSLPTPVHSIPARAGRPAPERDGRRNRKPIRACYSATSRPGGLNWRNTVEPFWLRGWGGRPGTHSSPATRGACVVGQRRLFESSAETKRYHGEVESDGPLTGNAGGPAVTVDAPLAKVLQRLRTAPGDLNKDITVCYEG